MDHTSTPESPATTLEKAVVDPVCGMSVIPPTNHGPETYDDKTYWFCSASCQQKFHAAPAQYVHKSDASPPALPPVVASGTIWTCPMHPEIQRPQPGACPICGMPLEPILSLGAPEDDAAERHLAAITRQMWICAAISIPLLLLAMSDLVPGLASLSLMGQPWMPWVQFAMATPVVIWGGEFFFRLGWISIITRQLNMYTLIAVGVTAAYGYSVVATIAPGIFPATFQMHGGVVPVYFEAAAVITTLVLLGEVLQLRARSQTSGAIRALLGLAAKSAHRIGPDGTEADVPLEQVAVGDRLRILPGEKVPVDGKVIEGSSHIDESMVTGEPMLVSKGPGEAVTGATINSTGMLIMEAERVGADTLLARIVSMVSEAQRSRAPIQRLADQTSAWFVPAVLLISLLTFVVWALVGPEPRLAHALVNAIAVLIIACPCALGLATPMSIMVGTGRGALMGILFRDAEALELLERVNTLVIDKTGTLTEGKPRLLTIEALDGNEARFLQLAASLERGSEHPLAQAILAEAKARDVGLITVEEFESVTGQGVRGVVDGHKIALGNQRLMDAQGIATSDITKKVETLRSTGQTIMYVSIDGELAGILGVADPIKASSAEALAQLRDAGVRVIMLTGDSRGTAQFVADSLGIAEVFPEVMPQDKVAVVKRFLAEGLIVAMAGDGINDAPALAQASVGIAMGTGTDIAMHSAGVTLVKGDLRSIALAMQLSRATISNIRQNLFLAFIYNGLGVPIAAGVLYPIAGILLSPMYASAAMSLSSVSVIANALRLRTAPLTHLNRK